MSEELKYKVGDEVLVRAKILEADGKTTRYPYLLSTSGWLSEEDLKRSVVEVPQKPKVPQAVMDWYEETDNKIASWYIAEWLNDDGMPQHIHKWLYGENHLDNQHALATLIAYGPEAVEVEKEKKYRVVIKPIGHCLAKSGDNKYYFCHQVWVDDNIAGDFTKQEIIDAGFEGVFDNPMFEVEEVQSER